MIKRFDKSGAVALNKRKFNELMEIGDYEAAFDKLMRYSEVAENPDLHLHCGMLYMLMSLDSDDRELLTLAHREFMMYIAAHHDCVVAYRNVLAVALWRRDTQAALEIIDWIKLSGFDATAIADELEDYGLKLFADDGAFVDLEGLFPPSAFGILYDGKASSADDDSDNVEQNTPERSKIIPFRGRTAADDVGNIKIGGQERVTEFAGDGDEDKLGDEFFKILLKLTGNDGAGDDLSDEHAGDVLDEEVFLSDAVDDPDIRARLVLRDAQLLCAKDDTDAALARLDEITRDGGRLYYCAECLRADIMIQKKRYAEAQAALNRAYSCFREGALAGTLQCKLYEITDNVERIPDALRAVDVTDYADADHVYKAMQYAIKYCTRDEAIELAEDYIDEFNMFDIRMLHAQMLYNSGEKSEAVRELYIISRILYDDFGAQYYYLMAKAGIDELTVDIDVPQSILGMMIDNIIALVNSGVFVSEPEIIESEPFRYGLEMFLTLEFRNTRNVMKIMFDTLRKVATDKRLETAMRNALVSPYVEPLVKSVILGELLSMYNGECSFLTEDSLCPVSDATVPTLGGGYSRGYYLAYALVTALAKSGLRYFIDAANALKAELSEAACDDRDIAYYLWKTVKTEQKFNDKDVENRIEYALGYDSRAQAAAAFKAMAARLRKPN